jgi:hypothetical protein
MVWPDKTPILSDFLGLLKERSRQLALDGRLPVPMPPLYDGEQVVIAVGPRCNLTISAAGAFVITSMSKRIAFVDCGPLGDPGTPEPCRDLHGPGTSAALPDSSSNRALRSVPPVTLPTGGRRCLTVRPLC